MSDDGDRPTVPDIRRAKPLSRQDAKRIRNLYTQEIHRLTDGRDRLHEDTVKELQATRRRLEIVQNERAWLVLLLLGCVQRFGGSIVFDKSALMTLEGKRELVPEITDTRVSLTTRGKLESVVDSTAVDVVDDETT